MTGAIPSRSSSGRACRTSTSDLFERRVFEHEPALDAVVGEPHGHDPVRGNGGDDSLAERRMPNRVARGQRGHVPPHVDGGRAVAGPRGGPEAVALDFLLGELVEETARKVVAAGGPER